MQVNDSIGQRVREIVERVLTAAGVGMLPAAAFTTAPFATDWLDTAESQRLLNQAAARQHLVVRMGCDDDDAFIRLEAESVEAENGATDESNEHQACAAACPERE